MNEMSFQTALDVGGGEGYLGYHIQTLFGAQTVTSDLSLEANCRAWELYQLPGVAIHAAQLPFADKTFDLVVCSEVLEHVEDAVDAILELDRITRKYLIITTLESCPSQLERWLKLRLRDFSHSHYEINWWHPQDFTTLLGKGTSFTTQVDFRPQEEIGNAELQMDAYEAQAIVKLMAQPRKFGQQGTCGIVVWKQKSSERCQPRHSEQAILDHLFANTVKSASVPTAPAEFSHSLLGYLCCPVCLHKVDFAGSALTCSGCTASYPIERGVPLMYPTQQRPTQKEPPAVRSIRRLLDPKNIARSKRERGVTLSMLKLYYAYNAFRNAPTKHKIRMVAKRLGMQGKVITPDQPSAG
jgi:uncharacterized protein YbaR (Trm112 family)